MEFKPYPEYKDSGLPWLDKIPAHWSTYPNRAIFEERITKGNLDEELLSVTIKGGIIRQKDFLKGSSKKDSSNEDKSNYKLVLPGDLAYNKMRMWQGAVGASEYRGIVSPAYIVITPRLEVDPWYYHYLLRTPQYIRESYRYSYGICDDQLSLRFKDFKVIGTLLPPVEEQCHIVQFIRSENNKVNQFIRNKQKLITLLKEQKQNIINQAVTRGVNPNVGLKPSGIEWLGDIPEHWNTKRVKYSAEILRGKFSHRPRNDAQMYDGPYPFIQTGDVARAGKYVVSYKQTLSEKGYKVSKEFPANTLVMTIAANIGDVAILTFNACFPDSLVGFYPKENTELDYLYYAFLAMKKELLKIAPVSTQGNLNIERVGGMYIPQPSKNEQQEIVRFIEVELEEIDAVISRTQREIELMQEYRTRLISDAVTGKIDVRDIPVEAIDVSEDVELDDTLLDEEGEEALEDEKELACAAD